VGCRAGEHSPLGRRCLLAGSADRAELRRDSLIFVGHDWAEDHHDVVVLDVEGAQLAGARVGEGVEGVGRVHALVAELVDGPPR
jgi:hypothetical protein